jgi:RNA polymerase subunit RPABC4/transcription elongation factor Spt4
MGRTLKVNGAFVLILASALMWANIAWAVPWNRINEELDETAAEELPIIEYAPLTYAQITYDEILPEIFVVAAAGETWTCASCGRVNPADAKYCSACGTTKEGGSAGSGLSNARVCPKCGFVNEKGAKFCGDCRYNFARPEGAAAELEMVYVPGRGYVPRGTMIEPGHARTGVWATGLVMWLLVGPGVLAAGITEDSFGLYTLGGILYLTGQILFIVGIGAKTKPVYASRTSLDDDVQPRLACARRSLEPEGLAVKVELPLFSF